MKKITTGFVIQTYNGEKCVAQEFVAGDEVDWEDDDGEPIIRPEYHDSQPFDMIQPNQEKDA